MNLWKAADEREQTRTEVNAHEPTAEKKPVIVWIYGGAFEVGGTTDPQYDCHNLVKEDPDVIVVTQGQAVAALRPEGQEGDGARRA